ncbi:hypothetical protein K469DRAFT_38955 [Zopfia rhizophila CBS 207.26]|uniref:DUF659 domain-containing protein n=1 Tax=Zopfia rhizophila CBS 207.26 TaxID=1314779 RepID=A0A6A6DCU8_9PEZI|nr:hypothetical protein K469DRAFT_38955 [Zopfia rhizophila CBS 207.26]
MILKRLRPAYNPPSRYRIAGPLLTETYKETKEKMEKVLGKASGQVTLVSDGWLIPRGEAIINYVTVTRRWAIFLKISSHGQGSPHRRVYCRWACRDCRGVKSR